MKSDRSYKIILANEQATQRLGRIVAESMPRGIIFLKGDLGTGKTYLSQALIRAAGFTGRVKSPTYTLVEPYELAHRNIYHFDLYRLQDEEELLFIGCDEYFESSLLRPSDKLPSLDQGDMKQASVIQKDSVQNDTIQNERVQSDSPQVGSGLAKQNFDNLCLIEWPEKAASILPSADIELTLEYCSQEDVTESTPPIARQLTIVVRSEWGQVVRDHIQRSFEIQS